MELLLGVIASTYDQRSKQPVSTARRNLATGWIGARGILRARRPTNQFRDKRVHEA
jgi:hypothetical protein